MENSPILSILIPVYNADKFIHRCLDSIVNQKAFNDDVEIILINDGSKDNSLFILTQYADRYTNIKLISRENKGIGPTRNELIKNATGRYFWFIDADDYVSNTSLSVVLPLLECDEYDMLLTTYYWGNDEAGRIVKYAGEYSTAIELTDNLVLNNSLWTRIYRTSIVKESGIMFEHYIMGEDFDVILKLTPLVGKVKCIEKPLYNYIFNPNSAVGNVQMSHRMEVSEDSMRCIIDNMKFLNELPENQQSILKKHLDYFTSGYIFSLYNIKFPISLKNNIMYALKECGAVPVGCYKKDLKHRLFFGIVNNSFLCKCSFYLNSLYLKLKGSK